jgi:hypothetical protein
MLRPSPDHWNTDQTTHFLMSEKNMANGTKGWGKPLPLDSHPVGDRLPVPHTPLATFMAWCIAFTDDAPRGDAELETDWERSGLAMGGSSSAE